MLQNAKTKWLSWFLSIVMVFSLLSVGSISAEAADDPITVTIADVTYRYKDMGAILDLINEYRSQYSISSLTMDQSLMSKALIRASELSLYASTVRPNGQSYMDGIDGQLISYGARSNSSIMTQWKNANDSNALLTSYAYHSVGIGVVEIKGSKHVCVLFSSSSAASSVNSSVYAQSNETQNQSVSVLPSRLTNIKLGFSDGLSLMCGSSVKSYLYVTNQLYSSVGAYLTADNMNVTLSNTKCFSYTYNKITAVAPGETVVTIRNKQNSSIAASATLKAVALSFDDCSFAAIPDQYYTGQALTPSVSGKDSSGETLVAGTDFRVEYVDNVQPGTATVNIIGLGKYAGGSKQLNFNIVVNQSSAFTVSAKASPASITTGETSTITASQSGGIAPVTYTFAYALQGSSSWQTIVSSSSQASCSFKPTADGTYNVRVTAVDSGGRSASNTVSVKAESQMVCSVTLDKEQLALGSKVTITAVQQGGVSPTFAFSVKTPSSSWKTLKDFSSISYYTYLPTEPGDYTALVKFKSTNGQSDEVYRTFKVTGTALSNTSSVSASSVSLGSAVTLKGAASGGAGTYQFAYYEKLSSASSWTTLKDFSTTSSVSFTPSSEGSYSLLIKVKDSTGNIVQKTFSLSCLESFSNLSTLSASQTNLGKSVVVKASANSSQACTYAVLYRLKGASSWTTLQDYSSTSQVTFKPSAAGNYEINVKAQNASGVVVEKTLALTVNAKLVNSSSLSASSIYVNGSVTVKCAASGGAGSYTYLVRYRKSDTSAWTVKQNYSSTSSVAVSLTEAGSYEINTAVKDALGDIVYLTKTLTVNYTDVTAKLTLAKSSIVLGQSNTLSASASGGTGTYTYAFYYKLSSASSWTTLQNFSSTNKVSLKPSSVGTWDVKVIVKDSAGTVKYATSSFKTASSLAVTGSLSASSIFLGQKATATVKASGGSGTGYTYAVYLKQSDSTKWNTKQDFKANTSVTFTPANTGKYDVCVKAKDSTGSVASKYLTLTVKPAVAVTASLSASSIICGQKATVTAKAANGSGTGYTYAVYLKQSSASKWTTKQDFKSNASVTFTPAKAVKYDVCVKAKDSIGGVAKKYLTLTVKPAVTVTASLSASSIKLGQKATVTAKAANGSGSGYTYAVYLKQSSASKWTTKQDFKSNASVTFTPAKAVKYDVCVKAKDSIGGIARTYLTLTVTN